MWNQVGSTQKVGKIRKGEEEGERWGILLARIRDIHNRQVDTTWVEVLKEGEATLAAQPAAGEDVRDGQDIGASGKSLRGEPRQFLNADCKRPPRT